MKPTWFCTSLFLYGCLLLAVLPARAQTDPSANSGNSQSPVQNAPNSPLQQGVNHSQTGMEQESTAAATDPQAMKDKMFLRRASECGVAEVELGKLALSRSSNDEVKRLAQKMIDDHSAMVGTLQSIAESMGVMTSRKMSKVDQAEYDTLKGLSGEAFDKDYLTTMIKDHRRDLHEFRQEAATATDPALKDAAQSGAKVIREHLTMVNEQAKANGVEIRQGARPPAQPQ